MQKFLVGLLVILFFSEGVASVSDDGIVTVSYYISHANRLVRENNFDNSEFFYKEAMRMIDSLRVEAPVDSAKLDSLEYTLLNHYDNFNSVKKLLDYSEESKVFHFNYEDLLSDSDYVAVSGLDSFPSSNHKKVKKYVNYYSKRASGTFTLYRERAAKYIFDVRKVLKMYGLPQELAYLPMIESGYNPFAHSYAFASGMWQFTKSTGKMFGLENNWWIDERRDVVKSTVAASKLLRLLYSDYKDWYLALAAYNCGQGGVNRRIRVHKSRNFWSLWRLPRQTKNYVPKFIAVAKLMENPDEYGLSVLDNKETLLDTVHLDSCVNLKPLADICNITYEEIKSLNPELRQWCLPPYADNYALIIPAEAKVNFREKYSVLSDSVKFSIEEYEVIKGDNISKIAKKFKIKSEGITSLNGFDRKRKLSVGEIVKVPKAPLKDKWFTGFNNKYLTYYDDEPYYLEGRKSVRYRVRKGDSVWAIARKFGVNLKRLKAWNKIGSRNIIRPGQSLIIYL